MWFGVVIYPEEVLPNQVTFVSITSLIVITVLYTLMLMQVFFGAHLWLGEPLDALV